MCLKTILFLLHVIRAFIPEKCIVPTEMLRPTFDQQKGLDKLMLRTPVSENDALELQEKMQHLSSLPISEVPLNMALDFDGDPSSLASGEEDSVMRQVHSALHMKQKFMTQVVDVATILLIPVCVKYRKVQSGDNEDDEEEEESVEIRWLIILRPTKGFNFVEQLMTLVNNVDKVRDVLEC